MASRVVIMSKITTLVEVAELRKQRYTHTLGVLSLYRWQLKEYKLDEMTSQGIITIESKKMHRFYWHMHLLSKIDTNNLPLPAQEHSGWGPGNFVIVHFVAYAIWHGIFQAQKIMCTVKNLKGFITKANVMYCPLNSIKI